MAKECGLLEALNVKVMGHGDRILVLSHGFGGNQTVWTKILPSLVGDFDLKVIVFDMVFACSVSPSHFDFDRYTSLSAYATDLLAILEELKVEKCTYVGHSISGMVGCIASIQKPQLFQNLILLCASPRYLNDESYEGGLERGHMNGILDTIICDNAAWASSFAPQVVGVDEPSLVKEYATLLENMKPEIAFAVAKTILDSDMRSMLREVRTPCRIIQTRKDRAVPTAVAYYMQENLGGDSNTVDILETDGHLPQLSAPDKFLQLLAQVLDIQRK